MKITRMLSLVLIVTLLAAACSGGSNTPTATPAPGAADPVTAVKDFFTAAYSGQDTSALVCSTPGVADAFTVAAAVTAGMQGASVDTSGLTFTVKNQTADTATVTVAGQLAYISLSTRTPNQFPSTDVNVVNVGGTWKFCGGAS